MPSASEVLSSASLLLTIVAVLFALWYPEIKHATEITVPDHPEDAAKQREAVREALTARVLPLLLGTAVIAFTFTPVIVSELTDSVENLWHRGSDAVADYDPATIALTAVVGLALFLVWLLSHQARRLLKLRKRLTP